MRIVAEKKAEPLTVETVGVTFKVLVRPIGKTRQVECELKGMSDSGTVVRKARFALVKVVEAMAADGPLVVALDEDGEDLPAMDPKTWPALLEFYDELAFGIVGKAQELGEKREAQLGNSSPASV